MTRCFVRYDRKGAIVSVARVDIMTEGREHPFALEASGDVVIEVSPDHPAFSGGIEYAHQSYKVQRKRLVAISDEAPRHQQTRKTGGR